MLLLPFRLYILIFTAFTPLVNLVVGLAFGILCLLPLATLLLTTAGRNWPESIFSGSHQYYYYYYFYLFYFFSQAATNTTILLYYYTTTSSSYFALYSDNITTTTFTTFTTFALYGDNITTITTTTTFTTFFRSV